MHSCNTFRVRIALACVLGIVSAAYADEQPSPVAADRDAGALAIPASVTEPRATDRLASLTPSQRGFIERLRLIPAERRSRMCFCVAPDTPQEYIDILNEIMYPEAGPRYEHAARWPGAQGSPLNLTYSFVPDGVNVPANAGLSGGTNQIHAMFNGLFGSPAAWQSLFAQCFDRWASLSGLSYRMVSDDGAVLFSSPGSDGFPTRGDVRISAIPLDGASGVLAYNNFPEPLSGTPGGGDMVLDADDGSNWSNPANNYRFLRNTVSHEHGHGVGLMHVCPDNDTKLMEPAIVLTFDGPQHDDIRSVQRHYGDRYENNDTAMTASGLGSVNASSVQVNDVSVDDNADADYYAFSVVDGRRVSATVTPVGLSYQSGAQVFIGCFLSSPTTVNSHTIHNLELALIDADGSTVLLNANTQAAGQPESFSNVNLPGPGTYFLRVRTGGATDDIQLYNMSLTVTGDPGDGDFDEDGDVDLADYAALQTCLGPLSVGCEQGDFDVNGLVDLDDYADFAAVQTGP